MQVGRRIEHNRTNTEKPAAERYGYQRTRSPRLTETHMENHEELLDSIIEDIAALLANGYLCLRGARARSEFAATPGFQADVVLFEDLDDSGKID